MDANKFHTVDWVVDAEKHNKTRLSRPRQSWRWAHIKPAALSWIVLASCGALIGAIAVVLTLSTSFLADIREGHCTTSWYLNESTCCSGQTDCDAWKPHPKYVAYALYTLISVLFALLASFIVTDIAPLAAGSGISEIKCIVSGFYAPQFLEWIVLLVKCVALPLTIASGLSVGKEGPSVHYAACVGHVVASTFSKSDKRKRSDLITGCCAAGVAVAFGSPIGGLLFGIEEIASHLSMNTIWRAYFCCLVATSVVSLFNPFRNGQLVLFSVQYDASWHMFELPFFVVLGVFGGLVGHFIIKANLRITSLRKRFWGRFYLYEALLLSLITALVCYWNPYLKVDMTKSMQILFHECSHGNESHYSCNTSNRGQIVLSLFVAGVIRLILLLVTYGAAKVPAGIFVPSLAIGALFGRLLGTVVWILYTKFPDSFYFGGVCESPDSCINPGAYAVLGAGALLAGVMHITLTVVVVMFEVTGAVHYIVPCMVVVGTTRLVSRWISDGGGIADMAIKMNNLPFLEEEVPDFHGKTLGDVMVPAEQCITYNQINEGVNGCQYTTYPVLNEAGQLEGAYNLTVLDKAPLTFYPSEKLETVYSVFAKLGPHTVYAVDKGKFAGLLTRKGMCQAHQSPPIEFTQLENRIGMQITNFFEKIERLLRR